MKNKNSPKKKFKKPPPQNFMSGKKTSLKNSNSDEQNFKMLFDKSLDGMLLVDVKTKKFLMANRAVCKMLGYSGKKLTGMSVHDIHPSEQLRHVLGHFKKQAEGGQILAPDIPVLRKNGSIFYADISASPIRMAGRECMLGIFRDITDRKTLSEKLEEEKETARRYLDIAGVMIVVIGSDQKVKLANKKTCQILGCAEKRIIGANWFDNFIPEHCRKKVRETFDKLMAGRIESAEYFENPVVTRSGKERLIAWHNTVLRDKKGAITGTLSSGSDITENKKAEEELRRSEEQLQTIFDTSHAGIIQSDPQGKITLANKRMYQMLGNSPEKLIGCNYIDHIPLSHKEYAEKLLRNLREGRIESIDTEMPHIKEDGAEMWGHVSARRTTNAEGSLEGIVFIISDITERKTLEEELLHAQKMESVGQLTGGIAHEFNNILTSIIGFGSLLQMKMKNDDPLLQHVKKILDSSNKAAELTHNLLSFSRKQEVNLKPVDLNDILSRVENFLKRLVGENIEFETKKPKDKLNILADAGHIEQAIINLAINAKDAMPDGGRLIISSEQVEIDRKYIQVHGHGQPGHYALLSVTDTGAGMSREIQGKIFDPFFTTKETGKASGLGLAAVYGIIKQHRGFINVYSEAGKGTCFRIYLPLTQLEKIQESASSVRCSLFGSETVLMAEDDAYLAKLSETVLSEFGYRPIMAANGEEAVKKFMENKDQIDVCVFDVIMPKKSGIDAYNEIKKIKPGVKVFFISGYASDIMNIDRLPEEGLNMLSKPFRPDELLMKIREALAE